MIALLFLALAADPWGDASPWVEYGPGAGYGQAYYPENILGPPDPEATPESPSYGEDNLLTLGENGSVVIEFTDNTIVDGEGVDFTVFENVMQTGSSYFRECAFVEVSQNGADWTMFPWNGETLEGLAGVWPTTGDDPTDPSVSGGDQFDLADLGIPWIRFVRLTDCGTAVADGGLCDIDAVVSVNWTTGIQTQSPVNGELRVSSPFNSSFTVTPGEAGTLQCHTLDGRLLGEWQLTGETENLNGEGIPPGVLLFTLNRSSCTAVKLVNR